MYILKRNKRVGFRFYLACLVFLFAIGIISLSVPIIRAAENIWNIQRDPGPGANTNNLDFFLTSNQATGSSLRLTANGSMLARNLYDLDRPTFYLNPDGPSLLNTLTVSGLNITGTSNVGIGTAIPGEKLDINGNARIAQSGYLKFAHSSQQDVNDGKIGAGLFAPGLNIVGERTDSAYRKLSLWGQITQLQNDGTNTWAGKNYFTGNVGIGTPTPSNRLSFGTGLYDSGNKLALYEQAGGVAVYGFGITAGSLDIYAGGNKNMVINQNGNVGIGYAAPANRLSFGTNLYDTGSKLALYEAPGGAAVFGFGISAGSLDIYSGGSKAIAVNQTGKVGIRSTAPVNDLHIKQSSNNWASGGGIRLERSDNGSFGSVFEGSDNALYLVANSGAYFCAVTANTTMYCSSDGRLKENIAPLDSSALDIISNLKPTTFNWKNNGVHSAGFIAQEVKEVLPEAVTFSEDMGYYGLSDSYFTPYMVKGIQELNDQVKNQQSEIDLLKKEIEELKKLKL